MENGLPLDIEFIAQMHDKNISGKIYAHMRALFHLSVSISLLYMMFPTTFTTASIGREQMMSVCTSYHAYVIYLILSLGIGRAWKHASKGSGVS
jgi:hypothetical protein